MATRYKIKIADNEELRIEIDKLYEQASQIELAQWAIHCAKHVLTFSDAEIPDISIVENGFKTNELWQAGEASVHMVRQAGFKIHKAARECGSETVKNAIRTCGHAVGTGHMREHAMVCSDYAVKTVQLVFPDNMERITAERQWQLNALKQFK